MYVNMDKEEKLLIRHAKRNLEESGLLFILDYKQGHKTQQDTNRTVGNHKRIRKTPPPP